MIFCFIFLFSLGAGVVSAADGLEKDLKSGKKVVNFSGKENEAVTIKAGVRVIGSGPDKAVINDDIRMENGSVLENVTVNGKDATITIAKGASATLVNVTVRGGADAGIVALEGKGGTLTVRNSRIIKNRKGMYVLPGKTVVLSGNLFSENKEEGADLRNGVSGSVTGNRFLGNGEGGMELIVGGSNLTIANNTFSGNRSSGLALQAYSGTGGNGRIALTGNTFSGNGHYGVTCGSPSGGGKYSSFAASVTARGNTFVGNKQGTISGPCAFANRAQIQGVPENEAAETEETEAEETVPEGGFTPAPLEALTAEETALFEVLHAEADRFRSILEARATPLVLWRAFVWGVDQEEHAQLAAEFARLEQAVTRLKAGLEDSDPSWETKERRMAIREKTAGLEQELDRLRMLLARLSDRFAFFHLI